jgi:hypothetical protein
MAKILSNGASNAKTKKNARPTKILYLLPTKVDGKEMCPFASAGCRAACLNTAGRGAMNSVQKARLKRTQKYVAQRAEFLATIAQEINGTAKFHARKGNKVAIRLNGTSDQPIVELLIKNHGIHANVEFYDYTKNPKKAGTKYLASGHKYVITFSREEHNEAKAIEVLKAGGNAAVVFNELPKTWKGFKVIDGDERDDLMLDHSGVVLGLKAKGKARQDKSGFVVIN